MSIKPQTFQFDFGNEEKINSTTFTIMGTVPPDNIQMILKELKKHIYEQSSEIIKACLEKYHLKYSYFSTKEFTLSHKDIMDLADCLLHSDPYDRIHGQAGSADNYYAIMDYQKWISENDCEGCYYAIKKIPDLPKNLYKCKIIVQTFSYQKYDDNPYGYFAIRTAEKSQPFQNLVEISGEPVLPDFGCVDIIGLLMDIDAITTSGQAEKFAL